MTSLLLHKLIYYARILVTPLPLCCLHTKSMAPIGTRLFSQPWSSLDITTSACDSRHKNEVVVIKKENVLILSLMRFLAQMQRHEEKKMQSYHMLEVCSLGSMTQVGLVFPTGEISQNCSLELKMSSRSLEGKVINTLLCSQKLFSPNNRDGGDTCVIWAHHQVSSSQI